jgi:hypothetical protein
MPLDAFAPVTFAAAATAAGSNTVRSIVCGALTPRDGVASNREFYAVTASFLRRTFVTGDFGATGLHAVSLPDGVVDTETAMACLQTLDCETHCEHSLSEFNADFCAYSELFARMCAVIRRHRHTLRHLKVPGLAARDAPAVADALAACTAITSLDLRRMKFPFRSWQQLGPTLRTLKLNEIRGHGTDTDSDSDKDTDGTFRLLADNMPALRELEFHIEGEPSQDGFIELVSRLRSLSLRADRRPWGSVQHASAWPLALPNLEELLWWADGVKVDAVAVAVLRRAVALRAAHVPHASALAAVSAGAVSGVGDGDPCIFAPLANIQSLALIDVANDPASLHKILTAAPHASTIRLRWGYCHRLWDLLRAVASAASDREKAGRRRVRRVRIEVNFCDEQRPDPEAAARCIRALFPRSRYASFCVDWLSDVQLLPRPEF